MFLTPDELKDLTDRPQPKRQIEWLQRHGWSFEIGASGKPKVHIDHAREKLGGKQAVSHWMPDWSKV
jgi:hypothetical protein